MYSFNFTIRTNTKVSADNYTDASKVLTHTNAQIKLT